MSPRARVKHIAKKGHEKLKFGLEIAAAFIGGIIARPIGTLLGGIFGAAAASAAVVALTTGGGAPIFPITQAWLTNVPGGIKVERFSVPCPYNAVDQSRPPTGILHTTEGSFEGALSVFKQHYAPHFQIGRDRNGKIHILQFCPLGSMGYALKHLYGYPETNRWVRAQIEIVGFSRYSLWSPDPGLERALAALMYELRQVAGIPLTRPYPDNSFGRRSYAVWGHIAGWQGHINVPGNDHVDPGALNWEHLFKAAQSFAPILNLGAPEGAGEPILGTSRFTPAQGQAWTITHKGSPVFAKLAPFVWTAAKSRGVRGEVAYALMAAETGWGRYGGQVKVSSYNLCGLKGRHGFLVFANVGEGARACIVHLAIYAGAPQYASLRSSLFGRAKTVQALGGRWSPNRAYGAAVARYLTSLERSTTA